MHACLQDLAVFRTKAKREALKTGLFPHFQTMCDVLNRHKPKCRAQISLHYGGPAVTPTYIPDPIAQSQKGPHHATLWKPVQLNASPLF